MSILLATLFLTAQPAAQAPAAAPAAPPAAAPAKPKKEKKICRVDDADTGTHMVKRVCLTQEQDAQRGMNVDEFKATMPGAH
jgi:predicted secreted protein